MKPKTQTASAAKVGKKLKKPNKLSKLEVSENIFFSNFICNISLNTTSENLTKKGICTCWLTTNNNDNNND